MIKPESDDLRPIDILTGEIAIEVTGVVGVSPALRYFRYIASIFLTLQLLSQAPVIKLSLNKGIRTSRDLDLSGCKRESRSREIFRSFSGFIIALRNIYEKFIFWHLVI
jgi:hypothetical protein